jgi:hypothetical protein
MAGSWSKAHERRALAPSWPPSHPTPPPPPPPPTMPPPQVRGLEQDAVDEEGWAYAVDFPWLQHPPLPGSGKTTMKSFVRRRRWVRCRRPRPRAGLATPLRRCPPACSRWAGPALRRLCWTCCGASAAARGPRSRAGS